MESLRQDFIYALRFMRKHRGFAVLIVLCLALGIGANSAIFSVVDAVLLRPLPFADPESLVVLYDLHQGPGGEPEEFNVSAANFLAWRERARSFQSLQAMEVREYNLTTGGEPERVTGAAVTAGFFDLLGAETGLGRVIRPEEDRPGGDRTVVLSDSLWNRRFGSDLGILGRTVQLNGESHTVVGVLKPGFRFLEDAEFWVPMALDPANLPTQHNYFVAGRLKPDASLDNARSQMTAIASQLAAEVPDTNAGWTVAVRGLRENLVGDMKMRLLVVLAAVGFVLLIACANVGNLLLTRASEQRNEIAIRAAFGASRARLIRQTLTESVVLALAGGIAGALLAHLSLMLLRLADTEYQGLLRDVRVDFRVLGFTILLSLLTGLLPGLLPALKTSTPNLYRRLTAGGGRRSTEGVRGRRIQSWLVVTEVAMALVLLVCAGLMIKSFALINQVDLGFERDSVLTMQISLPESEYAEPAKTAAFWRDALAGVAQVPGVEAAAATTALPVDEFSVTTTFTVEGRAAAAAGEVLMANFRRVSPDYFRALGIPRREGRVFRDADDAQAPPVAVVSEKMARLYWPGQSALGKRLQRTTDKGKWLTVVGVVGDVQDSTLGSDIGATFYVPIAQGARPTMNLVAKTSVDPLSVIQAVRTRILAVDGDQPIARVQTLEDRVSESLAKKRFTTVLLGLFAALGMTLAVVGIYSVLSYSVSQRSHEIGVRMALGAESGDVVRLILRRGMALTLAGLVIGLAIAVLFTRVMESILYQVKPTDPVIFVAIAAGLVVVALLASYLPARRAARFDPIITLRAD